MAERWAFFYTKENEAGTLISRRRVTFRLSRVVTKDGYAESLGNTDEWITADRCLRLLN